MYVGNLPYDTNDEGLRAIFEEFGTVTDVKVIMDRETGRSRGFGFVEMDDESARRSMEELNGREIGGRTLRVNEAEERQRGGGGGGGGRGRW
jgi:RNA recognition motif-containing protein